MRIFLILLAAGVIILGLLLRNAKASGTAPVYGVLSDIPPYPAPGNPQSPSGSVASYCQRIYGANSQLIGRVPDKNAKTVQQANNLLGDINCGAVGIASKAVSAVIVTPAKKVWSWVT